MDFTQCLNSCCARNVKQTFRMHALVNIQSVSLGPDCDGLFNEKSAMVCIYMTVISCHCFFFVVVLVAVFWYKH